MATKKNLPLGDADKNQKESMSSVDLFTPENNHADGNVRTVGDQLRIQREAKGYSLQGMADLIRLRPRQILALEEGDYGSLPGQAFVVGFLKSYATALGLDAAEIVALYRSEEAGQLGAPQLAFPEPTSEGRRPGTNVLIGTCIAAILAVGGWYFYLNENKISFELVPDLPLQLAQKIPNKTADYSPSTDKRKSVDETEVLEEKDASTRFKEGDNSQKVEVPSVETHKELSQEKPIQPSPSLETKSAETDATLTDLPEDEKTAVAQTLPEIPAAKKPAAMVAIEALPVPADVPVKTLSATIVEEKETKLTDTNDTIASVEPKDKLTNNEQVEVVGRLNEHQDAFPQEKLVQVEASVAPNKAERIPETLGVQNSNARIILMAQQDVWVQIIADGNDVVLERVLGAGDTYMLPDLADLRLNTANAAGVEIRLDGESLGSVGAYGGIVRDLDLSPNALKQRFPVNQ